jgi:hypothetical protein
MKHRVNWKLDMGTAVHKEGDEVEIPAKHVDTLEKLGVITPLPEASGAKATGETDELTPAQLAKLSKPAIAAYAAAKYGEKLDETQMTKDALLAAVAELATKAAK